MAQLGEKNLDFRELRRKPSVADTCREGWPRKPTLRPFNPLGLPSPLTTRQLVYIFGIQGLGAACIDGGANFAIAYAMYRTGTNSVTMWKLSENTVAGDLGVTVFIQGVLTFLIASSMVHVDMRNGKMEALPYPWPDTRFAVVDFAPAEEARTKRGRLWRLFHQRHGLGRGLHLFSGSAVNDLFDFKNLSFRDWIERLFWTVWMGATLSALFFLIFWPIAIACVAPKWGGLNMAHTWTAPIIKLVFGFLLGLFMNPIVACIALGSEDAVRDHRREVHDRHVQAMEAAPASPTTYAERAPRRPERAWVV
ncbi:hypothetical protein BCR35DRAFT_300732 [Leucosporidium creatinivorum]|uniref:Uncharacterized protein n=1 Tax=Leucosporidium creatinivorum TaxID=106004 RepID=A0A1Y2G0I3_9BASI|nr:hypothetical protein BCR35DRAFT_300732 [Leucosporidium creatinivorum]